MEDWEDEERLNTDLNSVGFSSEDISGSEFEKKAQGGQSSISVSAWATGWKKLDQNEEVTIQLAFCSLVWFRNINKEATMLVFYASFRHSFRIILFVLVYKFKLSRQDEIRVW